MNIRDSALLLFAVIVVAFTLAINDIGEVAHTSDITQPSFFSRAVETIRKEAAVDPTLFH